MPEVSLEPLLIEINPEDHASWNPAWATITTLSKMRREFYRDPVLGTYAEVDWQSLDTEIEIGLPLRGEGAPFPFFYANPLQGPKNLSVQFTDESQPNGSPITAWLWDFGDGDTSAAQNPLHLYTQAGLKTVSLTVTNENGVNIRTEVDFINVAARSNEEWIAQTP
jgi:PKD repeat protein